MHVLTCMIISALFLLVRKYSHLLCGPGSSRRTHVWSPVVRSWWQMWLGHITKRCRLHLWSRHIWAVQPNKWSDFGVSSASAGHGGLQLVPWPKCCHHLQRTQLLLQMWWVSDLHLIFCFESWHLTSSWFETCWALRKSLLSLDEAWRPHWLQWVFEDCHSCKCSEASSCRTCCKGCFSIFCCTYVCLACHDTQQWCFLCTKQANLIGPCLVLQETWQQSWRWMRPWTRSSCSLSLHLEEGNLRWALLLHCTCMLGSIKAAAQHLHLFVSGNVKFSIIHHGAKVFFRVMQRVDSNAWTSCDRHTQSCRCLMVWSCMTAVVLHGQLAFVS